jgi:peptidoglycan/LPS O-acetylase OafA/YrhL
MQAKVETSGENGSRVSSGRVHLPFLDGLRGLAALYVLICHEFLFSFAAYRNSVHEPSWFKLASAFGFGHTVVTMFIVLSGFCLMLPVSKKGGDSLSQPLQRYLGRRANRILPPYFAALAIFAPLSIFSPYLNAITGSRFDQNPGHELWPALISHLLLVHNFSNTWNYRFDVPMWSVATEWQIYFLFPLVLLPLKRLFGAPFTVLFGFLFGFISFIPALNSACYWYVGSFALGMFAAEAAYGRDPAKISDSACRNACYVCWAVLMIFGLTFKTKALLGATGSFCFLDILAAAVCSVSLLCLSRAADSHSTLSIRPGPIYKICSSKAAIRLGVFSYSIYLVHYPVLALLTGLIARSATSSSSLFLELVASTPIVLSICYLFHLAFERPTMNHP